MTNVTAVTDGSAVSATQSAPAPLESVPINNSGGSGAKPSEKISPRARILTFFFFIVALAVLTLPFVRQKIKFFSPTPVSAAEIIKRNIGLVVRPNTIYHQKTNLYDEDHPNQPMATYERWDDQETPAYLNHVIYPEHPFNSQPSELWQWFDLDTRFEAEVNQKILKKEIYIYNRPGEREEKKGSRLDLQQKYDELLNQGRLTSEIVDLNGRPAFLIRDARVDKSFDALYFDQETFRLLRTESVANAGSAKGKMSFLIYEIQEALPRNEENLKRLKALPISLEGFEVYQRYYDTSQDYGRTDYEKVSTSAAALKPPDEEKKERDALRRAHVNSFQSALELYFSEFQRYPDGLANLLSATPSAFLVSIPFDPLTNSAYEYRTRETSQNYQLCANFETETYGPNGQICFSRPQ